MNYNPEEIQTLIIAEIMGDITDQEKTYLDELMAKDKDVRLLYEDMYSTYHSPEATEARKNLDQRVNYSDLISHNRRSYRFAFSAAAILLVMVGIYTVVKTNTAPPVPIALNKSKNVELVMADGKVVSLDKQDTSLKAGTISLNNSNNTLSYSNARETGAKGTIRVPAGRFYNVVLSDGSKVTLNSATKLEFPFVFGDIREVWIDGEAYLDIEKNDKKPFIVHLPNSIVKVLGTSFNVNTYDDNEKISLVSGKVKLLSAQDSVILLPGKQAQNIQDQPFTVGSFNQDEELSWINGVYIFHDADMKTVASVIGRWYGMQLVLSDKTKQLKFVGAVDRNQPIEDFLENLKAVNGIAYSIDGNIVTIK
jgi:ferric-dicitrate binding protein FerR (iron transport regulator)